jgi:sodium/proline symporter
MRAGFDAMWVSRMAMTAIVVAAVLLALVFAPGGMIFNRVLSAWSALGAAFGPILVMRLLGYEPAARARFWSIACGFGLTVLFYALGTMGGDVSSLALYFLVKLAQLPGDPFERILPWIPSLLILRYATPQYQLAD